MVGRKPLVTVSKILANMYARIKDLLKIIIEMCKTYISSINMEKITEEESNFVI